MYGIQNIMIFVLRLNTGRHAFKTLLIVLSFIMFNMLTVQLQAHVSKVDPDSDLL